MKKLHKFSENNDFEYYEYTPELSFNNDIYFIYLHGSGKKGNNTKNNEHDYALISLLENGVNFSFKIICPQCPDIPSWDISKLEKFISEVRLPNQKLIISGYSMGGTATWDLAHINNININGIISVSGNYCHSDINQLSNISIPAIYGENDSRFINSNILKVTNVINQHHGHATLIILKNKGHEIGQDAFILSDLNKWILSLSYC